MKSLGQFWKGRSVLHHIALLALWVVAGLSPVQRAEAMPNIVLWDTTAPLATSTAVDGKQGWKPVPNDLLTLEADPPKARSDPGYYGREYSFKGDAVVENRSLAAIFSVSQGRVVIFSKEVSV